MPDPRLAAFTAALSRARALLELGRPAAAARESALALGICAADSTALQLHGLCQLRAGDAGARATLRAAIAAGPDEAHSHYLLGFADREAGDTAAAEARYREALRLSPDEPVYLRALAELLAGERRHREAIALARRAVELAPERSANHVTLGFVYSTSGDRPSARDAYEQALALDPNDAVAWNNLGCVELAQGRRVRARQRFHEALRLNPAGELAQDNLKLVAASRPDRVYRDHAAFERQLIIELCSEVAFQAPALGAGQGPGDRAGGVAEQVADRLSERISERLSDRREVHLIALLLATSGLRKRSSQVDLGLGLGLGLSSLGVLRILLILRLGPVGAALAMSLGAATLLVSRRVVAQHRAHYEEQLTRGQERFEHLQRTWLDGQMHRRERDAAIDRLLDGLLDAFGQVPEPPPV